MEDTLTGLISIALPLLIVGRLFLYRYQPVFLFYLGLCIVTLGYLWSTGAMDDVGATVLDMIGGGTGETAPASNP